MQQSRLFLQLLQGGHAFLRYAQGIGGISLHGRGRGERRLRRGGIKHQLLLGAGAGARRAVISSGKFHGQLGDLLIYGVLGAGLAAFPGFEVQGAAQRRKAGQGAGEVRRAGALPLGGVYGESRVVAAGQNGGGHAGKGRAWADFKEDPYAVGVHPLDHRCEFHRRSQLRSQQVAGLVGGIRVGGGGLIGVNADGWLVELHLGEGRGEFLLRAGYQRAVESGGDLEPHALEAAGLQQGGGAFYLFGPAGEH